MKEYKYITIQDCVDFYLKSKNKNMSNNKKNHWKAYIFLAVAVIFLVISVMAWHWEETAEKATWYNFWPYAGIVSIFGFVGMIYWFGKSRNKW